MDDYIDVLSRNIPDELKLLLNWFEDNYVGRQKRRGDGRRIHHFFQQEWGINTGEQ